MHQLCVGLRFDLTTCRRSDAEHFHCYTSLPKRTLTPDLVGGLQQKCPWNGEAVDVVVAMSHAKNARLALRLNAAKGQGRQAVRVEASGELRQGQTIAPHDFMLVWEGQRLVGRRRGSTEHR